MLIWSLPFGYYLVLAKVAFLLLYRQPSRATPCQVDRVFFIKLKAKGGINANKTKANQGGDFQWHTGIQAVSTAVGKPIGKKALADQAKMPNTEAVAIILKPPKAIVQPKVVDTSIAKVN